MRKIFVVLVVAISLIPCIAVAKKNSVEIPMNERLKFAILVTDATNFVELDTFRILRSKLVVRLNEKNIFNILNPMEKNLLSDIKTLENKGSSDVGDLVMFSTKNLDLNLEKYKNLGAQYLIHCEILGIGFSTERDSDFGLGNGIGIGIGTGGSFGVGIGVSDNSALRKLYSTAVNMQIIELESGAVVARQNLIGQALRHRKPKKGYNDASDEAYLKSLDDATKTIIKRVVNFASKNFEQYAKVAK